MSLILTPTLIPINPPRHTLLVHTDGKLQLFLRLRKWTKVYLIVVGIVHEHLGSYLERYNSQGKREGLIADRDIAEIADLCIVLIVVWRNSNWSNFKDSMLETARVCDYCKEFLKSFPPFDVLLSDILVDRMPNSVLTTMSVRSLREYIDAYGIAKEMPFVEKSDMINAIADAEITERNEEVQPLYITH